MSREEARSSSKITTDEALPAIQNVHHSKGDIGFIKRDTRGLSPFILSPSTGTAQIAGGNNLSPQKIYNRNTVGSVQGIVAGERADTASAPLLSSTNSALDDAASLGSFTTIGGDSVPETTNATLLSVDSVNFFWAERMPRCRTEMVTLSGVLDGIRDVMQPHIFTAQHTNKECQDSMSIKKGIPSKDDYSRGGTECTQAYYDRILSDVIRQSLSKAQRLHSYSETIVTELQQRRKEATDATATVDQLREYALTFDQARAAVETRVNELAEDKKRLLKEVAHWRAAEERVQRMLLIERTRNEENFFAAPSTSKKSPKSKTTAQSYSSPASSTTKGNKNKSSVKNLEDAASNKDEDEDHSEVEDGLEEVEDDDELVGELKERVAIAELATAQSQLRVDKLLKLRDDLKEENMEMRREAETLHAVIADRDRKLERRAKEMMEMQKIKNFEISQAKLKLSQEAELVAELQRQIEDIQHEAEEERKNFTAQINALLPHSEEDGGSGAEVKEEASELNGECGEEKLNDVEDPMD